MGFISEACVLGVSQILGQPIGYHGEKAGDIIQALCPVKTEAHATSSESSAVELGFHTDFPVSTRTTPDQPFHVLNPDYIILLSLRADRDGKAYTLYADARDICKKLTAAQIDIIREAALSVCSLVFFCWGNVAQTGFGQSRAHCSKDQQNFQS